VTESQIIAERIPNSELVIFERSGHFPFIEENAPFVDAVRAFNRRHPAAIGGGSVVA
jgi:proline iminopeptidase